MQNSTSSFLSKYLWKPPSSLANEASQGGCFQSTPVSNLYYSKFEQTNQTLGRKYVEDGRDGSVAKSVGC